MINFYEFERILGEQVKSKLVPITTKDGKVVGHRKEGSAGWKQKQSLEPTGDKSKLVPITTKDGKVVGHRKPD